MGYRSMIYAKIDNTLVEDFNKILKERDMTDYFYKLEDDLQDSDTHTKYVGEDLKWYDGYSDVDAINEFIDSNSETCGMIAIGEDGAEEQWGVPWNLGMYTSTNVEW